MRIKAIVLLIAAGFVSSAHAQLIFGSSTSSTSVWGAYYLQLDTGVATQIWTGTDKKKVNGLAADEDARIVYGNDAARLYKWGYNTVGTAPVQINGLYRLGSDGTTVKATGVDGLAMANGELYGYTYYPWTLAEDGIYKIDTTITSAGVPNMTLAWRHDDGAFSFQGLDFNEADGLFYATNTLADATNDGIYTIDVFGTGAATKIASFDSFLLKPDGLAIGGGYIWLTGKQSGETQLKIVGYNLATQEYDRFYAMDGFTTTGIGCGAAWAPNALNPVPEPASMLVLGLGALALVRRRRK